MAGAHPQRREAVKAAYERGAEGVLEVVAMWHDRAVQLGNDVHVCTMHNGSASLTTKMCTHISPTAVHRGEEGVYVVY